MLYEGNRGEASKFGFDDTPTGLAAASGPYLPEQWLALLPETRAHFAVAARDEASDLALLDGSVGGAVGVVVSKLASIAMARHRRRPAESEFRGERRRGAGVPGLGRRGLRNRAVGRTARARRYRRRRAGLRRPR